MNIQDVISVIDAYYEDKMRECEMTDEDQYRIYEMFLDWYKDALDLPDDIEDSDIDDIRESLWEEFCDACNVDPRSVKIIDRPYFTDDFDDPENYDEMIGDLITKD